MIKQAALRYFEAGISTIPVGSDKLPKEQEGSPYQYKWKKHQNALIMPNGIFDNAYGIAIICGKVSGGLECIDIDTKYDITGTLYADYKREIALADKSLLKKLVVEQSPSGGYHFIYRCSETGGNTKLAQRYTTDAEKIVNPKEKIRVLIETRGEGGYFVSAPTNGYGLIYGDIGGVNDISPQERLTLLQCAYMLNQVKEVQNDDYKIKKQVSDLSPFEDFNERGNIVPILEQEGWKIVKRKDNKLFFLRPGGKGILSADYDYQRKLLYVFSTSTEFESEKAYNHAQVLTYLKFNKDYSESAKWLLSNGYGKKADTAPPIEKRELNKPKSKITDTDKFIVPEDELDTYIEQVRSGTLPLGLTTGIPTLDEYFLFKANSLVITNGHDNTGKSVVIWFLALLSAMLHDWKWIIFSAENRTGFIKRKIMEFYLQKELKYVTDNEKNEFDIFFKNHFKIIRNDDAFNYMDILNIAQSVVEKEGYNCLMIDPYNSLDKEDSYNDHEYDYKAISQMRIWITKNKCSIYLNCHAHTESLRRMYPQKHELFGYAMPPNKADTEGGGKFANKADDFLTIHRLANHPDKWKNTEIHVRKIKETETGGRQTPYEFPVILTMLPHNIGFIDENGFNPILKQTEGIDNTETQSRSYYEKDNNTDLVPF